MKVHVKRVFENYSFFVTKNNIKADKLRMKVSSMQVCSRSLNPLFQKQPHLIFQNLWPLAGN